MPRPTELLAALDALPRVPLIKEATPIEELSTLSHETGTELWIKRDDLTASPYGGNKIRKLELLLADARAAGADTLITTGAYGSHHVLATSLFGGAAGFDVHAILGPQPMNEHVEENLRADLAAGATLHPVAHFASIPASIFALAARLRMGGHHPYVITHGGSSPLGTLGYVRAGLEIAIQVERDGLPTPDAIYCALGSGGTSVGLAIAMAAAGLKTRVVAARVTDAIIVSRRLLRALCKRAVRRLREADPTFPDVTKAAMERLLVDHSVFGAGYGIETDEGNAALSRGARDGISLDPTYTGKAFGLFLRDAAGERRGQRLLFILTLSGCPMAPLLTGAPPLPEWA